MDFLGREALLDLITLINCDVLEHCRAATTAASACSLSGYYDKFGDFEADIMMAKNLKCSERYLRENEGGLIQIAEFEGVPYGKREVAINIQCYTLFLLLHKQREFLR